MRGGETIQERFYTRHTVKYNSQVNYNVHDSKYSFRLYIDKSDGETIAYSIRLFGDIDIGTRKDLRKELNTKIKEIEEEYNNKPEEEKEKGNKETKELFDKVVKHFEDNPFKPKCYGCKKDISKNVHCCIQTYRDVDVTDFHSSGVVDLNNLTEEKYICEECSKKNHINIHCTDEEILNGIAELYLKEYLG